MTLPNGPAGVISGIQFGITHGTLPDLTVRTQDVVAEILKEQVQLSAGWNWATAQLWDGLERGVPFVLALLQALINRLFNTVAQFPGVHEALDAIEQVPQLKALVNTLTGVDGGFVELGSFMGERWAELAWIIGQLEALAHAAGKSIGDVGAAIADAEAKLAALVSGAVGTGGSGFPWTFPISFGTGSGFPWSFPISFGTVEKDIADVGAAILNAPQTGQQVVNQLVQSLTGVQTTIDHSLTDLHTAVQQLPALPPLATVAVGVQQAATTAGQMGDIITHSLQSDAAAAGAFLATAGWNAAGAVGQLEDAAENAIGGAAASAGSFGQALSGFFGGLFNGFTGASEQSATAPLVNTAAAGQASNIIEHGAAIISLQQSQGVPYAGTAGLLNASVNFANYPDGALPAIFTVTSDPSFTSVGSAGGIAVNNGAAVYQQSGIGSGGYIARYNVAPTLTDYQQVSGIFNSHAGSNSSGNNCLVVREDAAGANYVKLSYNPGTHAAALIAVVSNHLTFLGPVFAFTPIPGATYTLYAGDISSLYNFSLYQGSTLVRSWNDGPTPVSQVGPSNRYGGFEVITQNSGDAGLLQMTTFSIADQIFYPGPAAQALVSANESTASTSYADLATVGPSVAVTIGSSGAAWVDISCFAGNSSASQGAYMGFRLSGANTLVAQDGYYVSSPQISGQVCLGQAIGDTFLLTGLNPGLTSFQAEFKASAGTASFLNRRIAVFPI